MEGLETIDQDDILSSIEVVIVIGFCRRQLHDKNGEIL